MPDREKAIKGLKEIAEYMEARADVAGVGKVRELFDGWYRAAEDAIALLQEQELVRFKVTQQRRSYPFWDAECDGCGYKTSTIHANWKYCPECGKAVKWND